MCAGGNDRGIERVDCISRLARRPAGHFRDGGEPVNAIAGIDAFGAVPNEKIFIELQSGNALKDRHTLLACAAWIDRRFVDHDRGLAHRLAGAFRCPYQQREVGTVGSVDGGRHRDDEHAATLQVFARV